MALTPTTVDRLVFIRQLYLKGAEESRQPFPMSAAALLTFHDAIELFFVLAAEEKGARVKSSAQFMSYFEAIDQVIAPQHLEHKSSINRLNGARRVLKHDGILPDRDEIERLRNSTADFFEDNTPLIFRVQFAGISLVELVENDKARQLLNEASQQIDAGDVDNAIVSITRAFHVLWRLIKPQSIADLGSAFRFSTRPGDDERTGKLIEVLYQSVVSLDSAVEKLTLGIDPFKAARFKAKVPTVMGSPFKEDSYQVIWRAGRPKPTLDDCRWCFDFVIDVAIRMQRAVGTSPELQHLSTTSESSEGEKTKVDEVDATET